jgi:hypothetical protein
MPTGAWYLALDPVVGMTGSIGPPRPIDSLVSGGTLSSPAPTSLLQWSEYGGGTVAGSQNDIEHPYEQPFRSRSATYCIIMAIGLLPHCKYKKLYFAVVRIRGLSFVAQ